MPGRLLTAEQGRKGRQNAQTPDAIKRAAETRSLRAHSRNAVTWLKYLIDSTKTIPPIVKTRAAKLFADLHKRSNIYQMDEDTAQREADRIATRINHARAQYRLIVLAESDKSYLVASKIAGQWLLIDRKLNSGKDRSQGRNTSPTAGKGTALWQAGKKADEDQGDDGESA